MSVHHEERDVTLHLGDVLDVLPSLPAESVNCVVTSPPYFGLRDYGVEGQLGLEPTPAEYVDVMVQVFAQIRRVLRPDGVVWLNLGDSYASKARGSDAGWESSRLSNPGQMQKRQAASLRRTGERHRGKSAGLAEKNLIGIPWRVAFALQDDGWILRNDTIWHKPNAMPESVTDRLSSRHEYLFLLTRSPRYAFDLEAIKVPTTGLLPGNTREARQRYGDDAGTDASSGRRYGGNETSTLAVLHKTRNPGDVWSITTQPYAAAHFATMPPKLARLCVLAGCRTGGTVLDPFAGSGTTGMVARKLGRNFVGIDIKAEYLDLAVQRLGHPTLDFDAVQEASS